VEKLTLQDIKDIATYEKERPEFQKYIIDLKKRRRVSVGDKVTLLFENRETVRSQIQEMCRVERIVHDDKIQEEIDVYNGLIPEVNHLAATVFVEITQMDRIRAILDTLIGLDEHVSIQLDGEKIPAIFEPGRSRDDRIAAVQYVSFKFSPEQIELLKDESVDFYLRTDHPNYKEQAVVSSDIRRELVTDFASSSKGA
jgi:hypothetical protein